MFLHMCRKEGDAVRLIQSWTWVCVRCMAFGCELLELDARSSLRVIPKLEAGVGTLDIVMVDANPNVFCVLFFAQDLVRSPFGFLTL